MSSVDPSDFGEVEEVVGNVKDFDAETQMKEVAVGDAGKCLLLRSEDGTFSAIGTKCTHYGAPLIKGSFKNGKVQCPWHGACFNAKTGDIEDYPGLDSLHSYKVNVDKKSGNIRVSAKQKALKEGRRNVCDVKVKQTIGGSDSVVIIGGGPSSQVCAETLRCRGFAGKITIITMERHPPYDRAKLSKALDVEASKIYLRTDDKFYGNINVEIITDTKVTSVDSSTRTLTLKRGNKTSKLSFNKLVLATGGSPRTLNPTPGWDLKTVLSFRTVDDAKKISAATKGKNVVIVGSSFIGMEVASYLTSRKHAQTVAVVCGKSSKYPFGRSLGEVIGRRIMKMHEEKGIKFYPSMGVKELIGDSAGCVRKVILTNGVEISADVVVLGIGVTPNTDFLKSSNITVDKQGYIQVDANMKTNVDGVYAVGDINKFPLAMKGGELVNIQHWQMAHKHGQIAANNIVDCYTNGSSTKCITVASVPFFWTVQFGVSIRYAGHSQGHTEVVIATSEAGVSTKAAIESGKFVAFYLKDDVVIAVATLKCDPVAANFAQHVASGKTLARNQINEFLKC